MCAVEAVKAIVDIGTQRSLDPLIKATRQRSGNPDSRHRRPGKLLRPGYVKTGLTAPLRRAGSSIKASLPTPTIW
jgi:hypothetical protein